MVDIFKKEIRRPSCQSGSISEGQYDAVNVEANADQWFAAASVARPSGPPRNMWRFLFAGEDKTYWIQDISSGKYIARNIHGTKVVVGHSRRA